MGSNDSHVSLLQSAILIFHVSWFGPENGHLISLWCLIKNVCNDCRRRKKCYSYTVSSHTNYLNVWAGKYIFLHFQLSLTLQQMRVHQSRALTSESFNSADIYPQTCWAIQKCSANLARSKKRKENTQQSFRKDRQTGLTDMKLKLGHPRGSYTLHDSGCQRAVWWRPSHQAYVQMWLDIICWLSDLLQFCLLANQLKPSLK